MCLNIYIYISHHDDVDARDREFFTSFSRKESTKKEVHSTFSSIDVSESLSISRRGRRVSSHFEQRRAVGTARPLAFASEGGVAAQSMIPKYLYYGAWGLSGAAVLADIATKTMDAPEDMVWQTAGYHTAFHIPASIVLPAVIIHKIVHQTEHAVTTNTSLAKLSSKTKRLIPVAVAIASIGVVVPVVDHACEWAMEPTLGSALGLKCSHHHHDEHEEEKKKVE